MNRNRTLNIALGACQTLTLVLLVLIIIYAVIFFHWHINPSFYEHVKIGAVSGKATSSISIEEIAFTFSDWSLSQPNTDTILTLGNLKAFSFYIFFTQATLVILFSFFIIREVKKIIISVQAFDSFRLNNIASFKKIGQYCLFIFLITGFLFAQTPEGQFLGLYFHFTPIAFMLVTFILAEIFKEGNKLYEEQQYTI